MSTQKSIDASFFPPTFLHMKLSIIVPVRSETHEIEAVLESLLKNIGEDLYEILVIIAADATPKCVQTVVKVKNRGQNFFKITCVLQEDRGCGAAYRLGVKKAKGDFIAFVEGDGEADPSTLPLMIEKQKDENADLVVAERVKFIGYGLRKWAMNRVFNHVFGWLLNTPCRDLTYSYKLIRANLAKSLIVEGIRQDYNAETTMIPIAMGARYASVPTVWKKRDGVSSTSLNLFGNSIFLSPALRALSIKARSLS